MLEEGCCGFDLGGIFAIDQHVKQELTNSLEVQINSKKKKTVIIGRFAVQNDDNSHTLSKEITSLRVLNRSTRIHYLKKERRSN